MKQSPAREALAQHRLTSSTTTTTTQPPKQARPYETRRVSLSLPALGIHLPGAHASKAAHRSPPQSSHAENPPTKKVKRSHTLNSLPSTSTAAPGRPRLHSSVSERPAPRSADVATEHTPPPSPGAASKHAKLDTDGINDDIVVGVLEQLESTGNRPHLIKELAAILSNRLKSVESSSNPTAIISSRLTNYLKRPWTALAPCPLAKEQVTMHPRRVYYFLTTSPRQQIPEYIDAANTVAMSNKRVISPSVSSDAGDEEEETRGIRSRETMSPSPELDLSAPDVEFQHAQSVALELAQELDQSSLTHRQRGTSPPLEYDEREFTQTATSMQRRKESEQAELVVLDHQSPSASMSPEKDSTPDTDLLEFGEPGPELEETEEHAALRNHEDAAALFGQSHQPLLRDLGTLEFSSPILRPAYQNLNVKTTKKRSIEVITTDIEGDDREMFDAFAAWGDMKSPEAMELAELDDLLGSF